MKYQYFSEEILKLQEEIKHHPELQSLLLQHSSAEFEVRLAHVAVYCEIVLDGVYDAQDINNICRFCTDKLYRKRHILILPPSPKTH